MSDETVRPALTPEEWASVESPSEAYWVEPVTGIGIGYTNGQFRTGDLCNPFTPHQLAALCLHGQPFGFTREDVRVLHFVMMQFTPETDGWDDDLTSLADRIEALLPPE